MSLDAVVNLRGKNFFGAFIARQITPYIKNPQDATAIATSSKHSVPLPQWLLQYTPGIKEGTQIPVPFLLLLIWARDYAQKPASEWRWDSELKDENLPEQPNGTKCDRRVTESEPQRSEPEPSKAASQDCTSKESQPNVKALTGIFCKAASLFGQASSLESQKVFTSVLLNHYVPDQLTSFRTAAALPVLLAQADLEFAQAVEAVVRRALKDRSDFLQDWSEDAVKLLIWQPEALTILLGPVKAGLQVDGTDLYENFKRAIAAAHEGDRERHRHGASLYLRREEVVKVLHERGFHSLAERVAVCSSQELFLTTGQNTEVMTHNWKFRRQDGTRNLARWKVLHAEIVALCKIAKYSKALAVFFSKQAAMDVEEGGGLVGLEATTESVLSGGLVGEIVATLWRREVEPVVGCVGIVIAELDDNKINLDASQACPLCIKALKRWGVGEQTYTTDAGCLALREAISVDEKLVAESLEGALHHFGHVSSLSESRLPHKAPHDKRNCLQDDEG